MKFNFLFIPLVFFAQSRFTIDTTSVFFHLDHSHRVKRLRHESEKLYNLDLYEFHRPHFLSTRALLPHQLMWTLNFFDIADLFSKSYDIRTIQENSIDSINFSISSLSQYMLEPINSKAYTKITIMDGDFFYTYVDATFFQRMSKQCGIYMGFTNIEANAHIKGGLKQPQFLSSIYYYFDTGQKIIIDYHFQKKNWYDYGYFISKKWQQRNDQSFTSVSLNKRNDLFLRFYLNSNTYFSYHYTVQNNEHDFNKNFTRIHRKATKNEFRFNFLYKGAKFALDWYSLMANSNYYIKEGIEKGLKVSAEFQAHAFSFYLTVTPLYITGNAIKTKDIPFNFHAKFYQKNFSINLLLKTNQASFNQQFLETPSSQKKEILYEQAYFSSLKASLAPLKSEKIIGLTADYKINTRNKFSLSSSFVRDPLSFSFPDSSFVNKKYRYDFILSHHFSHHFSKYIGLKINSYYSIYQRESFAPKLEIDLSLLGHFKLFEKLNVYLRLTEHYLGERAYLYYMSKSDFFTIDSRKKLADVFYTSFDASFRIRSVLIRFRVNNIFRNILSKVRGYETTTRALEAGVEWKFSD